MKQLELRTYTRKEIAKIPGYEITNSNFSRNVKGTLMKWGYTFQWKHGGDVTIKEMPFCNIADSINANVANISGLFFEISIFTFIFYVTI